VRIIGGQYKGRNFTLPKGLPVRPTTDFAKEGLFNILNNRVDLDGAKILDLFSGTGHISLEFASRGAGAVTAVDLHTKCVAFLRSAAAEVDAPIQTIKSDVFSFLKSAIGSYDLIFADPPYDLPNIPEIHQWIMDKNLLNENAWLIIEHGPRTNLSELAGFKDQRKYGNVNFSFFQKTV